MTFEYASKLKEVLNNSHYILLESLMNFLSAELTFYQRATQLLKDNEAERTKFFALLKEVPIHLLFSHILTLSHNQTIVLLQSQTLFRFSNSRIHTLTA
jgi:hypothetical protein